jgi:hypothetical protein
MRFQFVLLVAALAASMTATAGARPTRTPVVNYAIKVEWGIGVDVKWSLDTGTRNGPCTAWSHEEGVYEIDAGSVGEIPTGNKRAGSFIHPLQRLQRPENDPRWASLDAFGPARVHIKRTLTQEGQTNPCGDVGAVRTTFPPNDCGERTYTSRNALIRPDYRDGFFSLKDILATPKHFGLKAISIDAPAQHVLFQRCRTLETLASPVGVQNVAVPVVHLDLPKLRNLQLGQRVQLEFVRDARPLPCGLPQTPGWACSAKVDLHVDIRRVKPPSGR